MMNQATKVVPQYTSDEARWAAVLGRDAQADGRFYFAVRTTGVYCRPSCPARRARRENVTFYEDAREAERAGFRPCQRCRPQETGPANQHAEWIEAVCRRLNDAEEMPALAELAAGAGLSTFHFHRTFRAHTGLTPKQYFVERRAQRMREQLRASETVTEALYAAGFSSSSRFYERSGEILGMRPKTFQAGGAGMRIRFAVGQCSLGAILVAATEQGICSIALSDDPETLVHDLQDRFPKAELVGADRQFEKWVATVVAFVETPWVDLDLPLDVRGTVFEQRVWRALREIPPGRTISYCQLAAAVGMPGAARAVARACARNPVAVAIPCHRVVRSDGDISGYRWGVERKRRLLEREAVH